MSPRPRGRTEGVRYTRADNSLGGLLVRLGRSTRYLRAGLVTALFTAALVHLLCLSVPAVAFDLAVRQNPIPPPADGCLIGAFTGSGNATLTEFNASAGRQHAMFLAFYPVGASAFDAGETPASVFCDECYSLSAVPYLTLEPVNATASSLLSASDVAWIEEFASHVGALNRPVFIRFGHEMNGTWYPWGWTHVTPEVYIAGYRQVATIFRERAPKAAMVWAPSQNWGGACDRNYSNWFPGDAYVDWVGLTSYQWPYSCVDSSQFYWSIQNPEDTTHPDSGFYNTFAVRHDKPMMIAETGCGDDDPGYYDTAEKRDAYGTGLEQGAQNWWISQVYGTGPEEHSVRTAFPRIHAITWFGIDDWQLGGSDLSTHSTGFDAYSRAVANAYWRSDALPPVTVATAAASQWTSSSVTFSLESTDGPMGSGVAHRWWSATGAVSVPTQTCDSQSTISAEGTTTVRYWSTDLSDNTESPSAFAVQIDRSAPITGDDHLDLYVGGAFVHLNASDALSGVEETRWSLDGVSGTGCTVKCGVGRHTLEYTSTDITGNSEDTHSVTFTVLPPAPSDLPTQTSISKLSFSRRSQRRTAPVKFAATFTPVAAFNASEVRLYLARYETVQVCRTVGGRRVRIRVRRWRTRKVLLMWTDRAGHLSVLTRLGRGSWRAYCAFPGNSHFLPSKSAARYLRVR